MLLAKTKLNSIEVLRIDEFGLISDVLKEYDDIKEKTKNPNNK